MRQGRRALPEDWRAYSVAAEEDETTLTVPEFSRVADECSDTCQRSDCLTATLENQTMTQH